MHIYTNEYKILLALFNYNLFEHVNFHQYDVDT